MHSLRIPVSLGLALVFALMIGASQSALAQQFQVLHSFDNGPAGVNPVGAMAMDSAGNLYGVAGSGGLFTEWCPLGCGIVYRLTPKGTGWVFSNLYSFSGGTDGLEPLSVKIGTDGSIYGITNGGGIPGCGVLQNRFGCGTVFRLQPPVSPCRAISCPWTETVVHRFSGPGGPDGTYPSGGLTLDQSGDIYGTARYGGGNGCGGYGCGVVYELVQSGGAWTETIPYAFNYTQDEAGIPGSGVILDQYGNLYGTAGGGTNDAGVIFELTPSGSSWSESTLYSFRNGSDGENPAALVLDTANETFYGATSTGGAGSGGTVFSLTGEGGNWTFTVLYSLTGPPNGGPYYWTSLTVDPSGNLYGTTYLDGTYGYGAVFKLRLANGAWVYESLHDFNGEDGAQPESNVLLDTRGDAYGSTVTSEYGRGDGIVWKIIP